MPRKYSIELIRFFYYITCIKRLIGSKAISFFKEFITVLFWQKAGMLKC